ncbi:MAG: hypothetical protein JRI68_31570, partial [Deltaproteobacteria bacterium]|nr:hypothetical protein [Deltaproteobacteria bacterium]
MDEEETAKDLPGGDDGEDLTETSVAAPTDSAQPVRRRLLIPLASVLLLLLAGFGLALFASQEASRQQASRLVLEDAASELASVLTDQAQALAALEELLADDVHLRDALRRRDREALLLACEGVFSRLRDQHGITHFYFHRPDRVNLLRVHAPDRHGDLIGRLTAREAERTGKTASGIELGPLGTFTLRVVRPVFDDAGLIGYLELGKEIEEILGNLHTRLGVELAVTIHKGAVDRSRWEAGMQMLGRAADWDYFPADVLIYSTVPAV